MAEQGDHAAALRGLGLGDAQEGSAYPARARSVHAGLRDEAAKPAKLRGPLDRVRRRCCVYILRRLAQTLLVLLVTSMLVFAGIFLVGDPVEMLVNPQADEIERERARVAFGLDKPMWVQYLLFVEERAGGRPRQQLRLRTPGAGRDPRAHAGDARARVPRDADRGRDRHSARPVRRAEARQQDRARRSWRLDRRLLVADVLGRAAADHVVRGAARLAAVDRPRTDGRRVRAAVVDPAVGRAQASRCCRRSTSRSSSCR